MAQLSVTFLGILLFLLCVASFLITVLKVGCWVEREEKLQERRYEFSPVWIPPLGISAHAMDSTRSNDLI